MTQITICLMTRTKTMVQWFSDTSRSFALPGRQLWSAECNSSSSRRAIRWARVLGRGGYRWATVTQQHNRTRGRGSTLRGDDAAADMPLPITSTMGPTVGQEVTSVPTHIQHRIGLLQNETNFILFITRITLHHPQPYRTYNYLLYSLNSRCVSSFTRAHWPA